MARHVANTAVGGHAVIFLEPQGRGVLGGPDRHDHSPGIHCRGPSVKQDFREDPKQRPE